MQATIRNLDSKVNARLALTEGSQVLWQAEVEDAYECAMLKTMLRQTPTLSGRSELMTVRSAS